MTQSNSKIPVPKNLRQSAPSADFEAVQDFLLSFFSEDSVEILELTRLNYI